jgi:hypothetical protein
MYSVILYLSILISVFHILSHSTHNLIIADFINETEIKELGQISKSIQTAFAEKFAGYGIKIIDKTEDEDRDFICATKSETVLRGKAIQKDSIYISFKIEVGEERKTYFKKVPYNSQESLEQNMTIMMVKILHVFENNILSLVQITTEPSSAELVIDSRIRSLTPWESYLPKGNHRVKLYLGGYNPIDKNIVVLPGNNRFI